jgi:hypothetical protein
MNGMDMGSGLLFPFLVAVVLLLWDACGLEASLALVLAWVRLCAWGLPSEVRERWVDERRSHLWEQVEAAKADGYAPGAIAVRVLRDCVCGIPADVTRRAVGTSEQPKHSSGTAHMFAIASIQATGRVEPAKAPQTVSRASSVAFSSRSRPISIPPPVHRAQSGAPSAVTSRCT